MTTSCNNCKNCVPLKKFFECAFCRKDEDTDDDDDEVLIEDKDLIETKDLIKVKDLVKDVKPETPIMLCRNCSDKCFGCKDRGCEECIEIVCCDCGVHMCDDCRNNETQCGCYGKCFWCGREVNRGSDGWPCWECDRWGCYDCRLGYNDCKECNPNCGEELIYSSSDEEAVSNAEATNVEATNVEATTDVINVINVEETVQTEVINAETTNAINAETINAETIDNNQNMGSEEDSIKDVI